MHSADDKRALFIRVVDDIVDQIRTGKLQPGEVLPTARKMADIYDVASMTAQRALRELQSLGLTYGVVGKGTFVHPDAPERVRVNIDGHRPRHGTPPEDVIADPDLNARLAQFLLKRSDISARVVASWNLRGAALKQATQQITHDLATLEVEQATLNDDLERYNAQLAKIAGQADATDTPAADAPTTPRRTRRSPTK